jgi:hypothetical protein
VQRLKRLIPLHFLVLIFLASSWALLTPRFFRVHDYTQAGRIVEMTRALTDGHFPVRWTQNFGYGYGMPLFEFYGPLPSYVGAVFYWFGLNVVTSIKLLYFISNVLTALGAYLLGKKLFGRSGGLIAAAALTLAPYRAVNLFVRGAINETWAIMFLPLILLGVIKVFQREKWGWVWLSLSLTGLFLSHNITTMLFLPVLGLFSLGYFGYLVWQQAPEFFRRHQFRWRSFLQIGWQLISSVMLAIGLSAFYLLPAFLEKDLTQFAKIIFSPYFDYHLHFLYIRQFFTPNWGYGGSSWGVDDNISFFLGWGQLAAVVVFGVVMLQRLWLWLMKRRPIFSTKKAFALVLIFGALLISCLYMSLLKAQWLWDSVNILKFAQFPWRWLSIAVVFLSLFLGSLTLFVTKKIVRTYLALLLVVTCAISSAIYFRPEKYLADVNEFYYTEPELIRRQLSGILPDYIPNSLVVPPTIVPDNLVINTIESDSGTFEVLVDRTQEKLIKTNFKADTLLSLAVADYPGWRLEIDNQRWNRQLGTNGNIEVVVPAGNHLVSLRFLTTPIRQYTDWLSLASLLIFSFLLLPRRVGELKATKKSDR